MRTFVFWGVLLTGLAIGGWLARGIGNRPIEHETWSGATRQSLLGAFIIGSSLLAALVVTRIIF
jgi:hypothetical protein